jgi:hypothetical protein
MAGLCNASVAKQVQGPIDGSKSQMWVGLGELMIHGFSCNVFLSQECCQNHFPLTGKFELMLTKMLLERIHFFREFAGPHADASNRWSLKTKTRCSVKGHRN